MNSRKPEDVAVVCELDKLFGTSRKIEDLQTVVAESWVWVSHIVGVFHNICCLINVSQTSRADGCTLQGMRKQNMTRIETPDLATGSIVFGETNMFLMVSHISVGRRLPLQKTHKGWAAVLSNQSDNWIKYLKRR